MADARAQVQTALDSLVSSSGLVGAGLVSRDGLPVLMRFKRSIQEDTFSAMVAALLGAAEAALQEMAAASIASALIETKEMRLLVAGIDDTHLLVAAAPASVDAGRLRTAAEQARVALQAILGG